AVAGVDGQSRAAWTRGPGVALRSATPRDIEAPGVQRALRDGIERGYEGALPEAPPGCECYSIVAQGQVVGLLAFVRDTPGDGEVTFWAVAIVPEHRAHAYGARALQAAERRLHREGTRAFYMRVPRGNGRGLYFALRCGYAPAI